MFKVKVLYLNDTKKVQTIFKDTLYVPHKVLAPTEFTVVETEVKAAGGVFVKVWETGTVLISTTDNIPKED